MSKGLITRQLAQRDWGWLDEYYAHFTCSFHGQMYDGLVSKRHSNFSNWPNDKFDDGNGHEEQDERYGREESDQMRPRCSPVPVDEVNVQQSKGHREAGTVEAHDPLKFGHIPLQMQAKNELTRSMKPLFECMPKIESIIIIFWKVKRLKQLLHCYTILTGSTTPCKIVRNRSNEANIVSNCLYAPSESRVWRRMQYSSTRFVTTPATA